MEPENKQRATRNPIISLHEMHPQAAIMQTGDSGVSDATIMRMNAGPTLTSDMHMRSDLTMSSPQVLPGNTVGSLGEVYQNSIAIR